MSKTFKVPVLIKIEATTLKEAEAAAYRFMSAAGEFTLNHEPDLHKTIKWWELADGKATIKWWELADGKATIKARKSK